MAVGSLAHRTQGLTVKPVEPDAVNQATQTKERIAPNRRGNAVSTLVSMEDPCLRQVLEDKLDNEVAEIAAL